MPIALTGGSMVYDQVNLFMGTQERYDWKLVGRKEMYIPYNNYNLTDNPSVECALEQGKLLLPYHANPSCIRWELHRVWHVQGTLKEGKRHTIPKRDYYFDEDTYLAGVGDGYDKGGQLYIVQWTHLQPDYINHVPAAEASFLNFDLNSGVYHNSLGVRAWVLDKPVGIFTGDNTHVFMLRPPR